MDTPDSIDHMGVLIMDFLPVNPVMKPCRIGHDIIEVDQAQLG